MKIICSILLTCLFFPAYSRNATFEKLCEVNKCWAQQKDVVQDQLPAYRPMSEKEWIREHLLLVENTLRRRSTGTLNAARKKNREACLNYLHSYLLAGNFPVNEDYSCRTPIFIDKHNNFCAVGYLLKATGNEQISRMIAAKSDLAYVRDMKYPELTAWAKANGFTIDELAWIQPGYPPSVHTAQIGNGVDGEVNELFVDTASDRLYVGGSFINADSAITANNIAFVTQDSSSYTWHSMGAGVNGTVNTITAFNNKIYAAGSFDMAGGNPVNNVASWDGSAWAATGCITGTVNKLFIFNDTLYAAGSFGVCSDTSNTNFAKWDGSSWRAIPGLNGHINTMQADDSMLVLGGTFIYGVDTVNVIKWNNNTGFQPFANGIDNEVKDLEIFQDTLYAVCNYTDTTHTPSLFLKLENNTWNPAFDTVTMFGFFQFDGPSQHVSFNTLCGEATSLNMGGKFGYSPDMIGTYASNCFNMASPGFYGTGNWFVVDDAINKMVLFNTDLIAGGKFKTGNNYDEGSYTPITLNGIAKRHFVGLSVPLIAKTNTFAIYPNPANDPAALTIDNNFNANHFILRDMNGKLLADGALSNTHVQSVAIPNLAPGIYIIEVSNDKGVTKVKQFIVKQ